MSLGSKILDYQKRTGAVNLGHSSQAHAARPTMEDPFRTQHTMPGQLIAQVPPFGSSQMLHSNGSSNSPHQTPSVPDTSVHPAGSLEDPRYRAVAARMRSTHLAQQLGRSLQEQQLRFGIPGTSPASKSNSPQAQQGFVTPSRPSAPQTTMQNPAVGVYSQPMPADSIDQPYAVTPGAPTGVLRHNHQQAMSDTATPPGALGNHSSLPLAGVMSDYGQDSPMQAPTSDFKPATPPRPDYERMRRSIRSAVDLTPQSVGISGQIVPSSEPVKRKVPSISPAIAPRKRVRLSLPGQDEAPALTPSRSDFQLYAPAGLPADDNNVDWAASIAAIADFEKQQLQEAANRVNFSSAAPAVPQHHAHSYEAAQTLASMHETGQEAVDAGGQSFDPTAHNEEHQTASVDDAQADMHKTDDKAGDAGGYQLHSLADYNEQYQANGMGAGMGTPDDVEDVDWGLVDDSVFLMQ